MVGGHFGKAVQALDHRVEAYVGEWRRGNSVWGKLSIFFARYGPIVFFAEMIGLCLLSLGSLGAIRYALYAVLTAILSAVSTKWLVDSIAARIARLRPFVRYRYAPLLFKDASDPSFPSNHAGGAFALATVLVCRFPAFSAFTASLAVVVALSRLYAGLHYLSDLVSGALLGTGVAVLYLWLFR